MQVLSSSLPGVCQVLLPRFSDERGWFAEAFNAPKFAAAGLPQQFTQDNQSFSTQGVLRGLHYQLGQPQGKLVRVLQGRIFDVAVDVRRDSPHFGQHAGFTLAAPVEAGDPIQLLWIPEGFAHGFLVLTETAEVLYKTTSGYYPQGERTIVWNDPDLAIAWPLEGAEPVLSGKDAAGLTFAQATAQGEVF
jgi:dTDP-4-dehydrorhamnose 3,5-epimerase